MEKRQFELADQARAYSAFRPSPPQELVEIILNYLEEEVSRPFSNAVDVGCGPGNSTAILSPYFQNVLGCDVSEAQIKQATLKRKPANVRYRCASAEEIPVPDSSVQLLTAATCFHWLDKAAFFEEARRVLAPGGVLAVYSSCAIYPVTGNVKKDLTLKKLTNKILYDDMKSYRSPCVQELFHQYEEIYFPFDDVIRIHDVCQTYAARASDAVGYIRSMSTFQNFRCARPKEAEYLLEEYQNSIMEVLETDLEPEMTPLTYRRNYFLIMCRKGKTSNDFNCIKGRN